jgi:prepilin-type N-terminal cleavage/methylation domain-containing protein
MNKKGFTLIELLVVIAVIAILAVLVILTLNPAQLLAQSRDSSRLSDMATLTSALNLYVEDQGVASSFSFGNPSTTYISMPDPSATSTAGDQCQGLGMSTSTVWHCASSSTYRNANGTGWIPVNFSNITSGSPVGNLPVDPTNQTSTNLFYSYGTNGPNFEISANPESQKYITLTASNTTMFKAGSNLALLSGTLNSGSVTQANMKMSLVTNTAFVDFGVTNSLTSYIGDKITISDSTGHQLVGWIKATGTGQTYGSQLLSNSTLNTTSSLAAYYSANFLVQSGGYSGNELQVTPAASGGTVGQSYNTSVGMLIQNSAYLEKGMETSYVGLNVDDSGFNALVSTYPLPSSWTQYILYVTANTATLEQEYVGGTSGKTSLFSVLSAVQVLTPSATGVTIGSAQSGSNYNWTWEDLVFNANDSSGYTYSITPN